MDCVPPGGEVALHRKGPERGLVRCLRSIGESRSHKSKKEHLIEGAQLAIAANGAMWCITKQPTLEGGTRATGGAREPTRRGGCRIGRGGGGGDD
jgi:hypothetical protein